LSKSKTDWLDKVYIYAALAATQTIQQARELLQAQGIPLTERQLQACKQHAPHRIQQVAQRGLPQRLYGLFNCDIYDRINKMAQRIEERLTKSDWQDKNDVDLVDKYLKLMQVLAEMKSQHQEDAEESAPGPIGELQLEEIFSRLEQAKDRQKIKDTIRQVAAATGTDLEEVGEPG